MARPARGEEVGEGEGGRREGGEGAEVAAGGAGEVVEGAGGGVGVGEGEEGGDGQGGEGVGRALGESVGLGWGRRGCVAVVMGGTSSARGGVLTVKSPSDTVPTNLRAETPRSAIFAVDQGAVPRVVWLGVERRCGVEGGKNRVGVGQLETGVEVVGCLME